MKWIFFTGLPLVIIVGSIMYYRLPNITSTVVISLTPKATPVKPLDNYSIENLSKSKVNPGTIQIGERIEEKDDFSTYMFYFYVEGKKVSGMLSIPNKKGEYPVIVMIRGYVDPSGYKTGDGTKRVSEYLATKGFITLAPDFLGYGESDNPSEDIFEARFQTFTTTLSLLASVKNVHNELQSQSIQSTIDPEKIGIWGHSNGGQIALTVLEITGKPYPAVLWAPVSKPFPYSILYYTDEADDYGKAIRKKLAVFEQNYDAENYNLVRYLDRITAPIQIHQGTEDEEVPEKWSDELVENLKDLEKDAEYFTYPGADHNLMPNGWNPANEKAITFYEKEFSR